jgi:hypothetical protein
MPSERPPQQQADVFEILMFTCYTHRDDRDALVQKV